MMNKIIRKNNNHVKKFRIEVQYLHTIEITSLKINKNTKNKTSKNCKK